MQAVADDAVVCRAPALAQDANAARESDDINHGQEVVLVAELPRSARVHARCGPAICRGGLAGQRLQAPSSVRWRRCCRGVAPARHDLAGVLVADLVGLKLQRATTCRVSLAATRAGRAGRCAGGCAGGARHWAAGRSRTRPPATQARGGHHVLQRFAGSGRGSARRPPPPGAGRWPQTALTGAAANASLASRSSSTATRRGR